MPSSKRAARAAALLGLLAVLAVPAAVRRLTGRRRGHAPAFPLRRGADLLRARPAGRGRDPPFPVPGRAERAARGHRAGLLHAVTRLGRSLRRGDGGSGARRVRRASLGAVAEGRRSRLRFAGRVRDWQQPSGSTHAQGRRLRAGRARDEGPRQIPARARGGAVRRAARADLRQGLPAHVCRVSRPRRPALRRRVQLAFRRHGRRSRAADAPLGSTPAAPAPAHRDERRARRARRDCDRHGRGHLGLEGERQQLTGAAEGGSSARETSSGQRRF